LKIGVVGLGFMGSTHLQAYQQVEGAEIVAVASSDDKKLSGDLSSISGNLSREGQVMDFGAAARYHTAEELIADPNVEAVDFCTPSYLHASQALAALAAGKHVLVEKPMALSGAECDQMIAAADKAGKVLMVAQVLRFWPDYVAARELIRSGKLGAVKQALFYRKCAAPVWSKWMHDKSRSGGGVFDLLIHDFDFCQHLFGKPVSIDAQGVEEMEKGIDTLEARLVYPGGPLVTIAGGWRHPQAYPFSMEFTIVCEGGTLDFHSGLRRLTLYNAAGEAEEVALPEKDGFAAELEAFVKACESGEPPAENRPQDSAEAIRMVIEARDAR
jgi:predicted dehydrogenase